MKRSRTSLSRLAFVGPLLVGALFLGACGSDSTTTTETTISTESSDSILDETTLAPIETTAPAAETVATEAPPETQAATETTAAGAETTVAGTETTAVTADADPSAALDAALVQFVSSLGVADPAAVAKCIREQDPKMTLESLSGAGDISPGLFRGMTRCGDGAFAKQASANIDAPVTDDQKQCLAQATFDVVADSDDATVSKNEFPDDIKAKVSALMQSKCKVTKAVADAVINDPGDDESESTATTVAP
jgi:hypothetical protein